MSKDQGRECTIAVETVVHIGTTPTPLMSRRDRESSTAMWLEVHESRAPVHENGQRVHIGRQFRQMNAPPKSEHLIKLVFSLNTVTS